MSNNRDEEDLRKFSGRVVNVGYGNFVLASRIVAVLEAGSLPVKRLRDKAQQSNSLLDATAGRKMRSVLVTDSRHVVLSALAPQTIQERLFNSDTSSSRTHRAWQEGELVS